MIFLPPRPTPGGKGLSVLLGRTILSGNGLLQSTRRHGKELVESVLEEVMVCIVYHINFSTSFSMLFIFYGLACYILLVIFYNF